MEGKDQETKKRTGRRKREEMSSLSSENSQGTPEPKRVGNTRQMADVVNGVSNVGETRNDPQVPALAAIWEVVVRIEANTNLLINEHKALKTHFEELQKSLQFTQADVDDMKKENQKLKDTVKAVSENNSELEKKVDQLENNLQSSIEQGNILEKKLEEATKMHDNLEQYSRKFNLEIYGIPEQEKEDTEEIVLNLAKRLNVNLEPEDIDIAHRMKKGNTRPRPIIVRFTNYYSRNRLYMNRKKLRRANFEGFIEGADRIYINENLTALRSQLFKKVREKKGSQNWRIWTLDGTIYVKTDPESSSAIQIKCEADLSRLRG